ncbi:MAG: succinate dehydrogenase cytochrome b subunit [Bacteroidetes bacterium]|nr:succinate dehydrogenase cytochrome b subunit [Bacteroidota bacterium]
MSNTSPNFLTSSIGKKFLMGFTGLFLISFLVVHVLINACIYFNDGGVTFNMAAHFMANNIIIRVVEVGLFLGIILHIVQALILSFQNNKARPQKYAVQNLAVSSKWYSRSMGLLGTLLLMFLIVHLANFWVPTKIAVFKGEEHNTFESLKTVFANPIILAVYLLGLVSLFYHLLHGFQSAFQTFGLNHKKYTPAIKACGFWYAVLITLLFASMPITLYLGLIK